MVTRKQLASLKKATEASANKRRRSGSQGRRSGSQVPPVRSPPPVAVAVPNLQKLNECKISGPDFRVPIPHRFGHVVGIQVPDYCNVRWAYSALPDKKQRPVPIAKTGSSKKKYKKSKGKQKAVDDFESDSEPSEPSIEESDEDESKSSHTTTETEEVEGESGNAGEEVEA
ncbi:hypothetical protein TREMEDRAFT_65291 [Tremella mesenterica DSM 1558]|uniref:uncharacterized protein n=1 Tax=Tremella mesenterica (strain ATCC 24925 / CBS 8224 / DSM 1558 / NBRC 9311 / NRRL Y-6157 / RJB 2259-6 / UBC 559-6) TaxID=578456 RepID=UPI00032B9E3B|nr:uncharacterized protein TREMEDRAFT_65291 [Tremella mesenterica DSM 1558]EIW66438.1 hypothetical protein TREMEDRAFT_65291 [Tremella mesenterica DSM 1558]